MKLIKIIGIVLLLLISLVSVNASDVSTTGFTKTGGSFIDNPMGFVFHANNGDRILESVTKGGTNTAQTAYLYYNTSGGSSQTNVLVDSVSFVGNVATFTSNPVLTEDKDYWIITGGGYYTREYDTAWVPVSDSYLAITNGVARKTSTGLSDGAPLTTTGYNVVSITTSASITPITKYLTIDNITLINNTYSNETNLNLELNISVTDTNTNINTTLFLSNGSSYDIGTNTENVSYNLTGISEGVYNIWTYSENNETNVTSQNYTYNFDLIKPTINNSIPLISNTYLFNGSLFSCNDTNLASCNISINGFNKANGTDFNLTNNGNLSYTITAIDLAGNNIEESGVIFIDPLQYFDFTYSNGTSITSFDLGGQSYGTSAAISTYDDIISLGSNTLLFEKVGFASTNITFTLTNSSALSITTNITESSINLRIYDEDTGSILTGLTTITLVSSIGFNSSTTTGYLNITDINFLSGDYQIIASHSDYTTETIYFTYDNQVTLNKDIYLLNSTSSNIGTAIIEVTANTGQFINGALCRAKVWTPAQNAYISVAEAQTNTNGQAQLNINLNTDLYVFECSKSGATVSSGSQILQTTETIIPLELTVGVTAPADVFGTVSYTYTNSTINATHQLLTFVFSDTNNLVAEACIDTYQQIGTKSTSLGLGNCSSTSSGTLYKIVDINNSYTLLTTASLTIDSVKTTVDSINFKGTGDISYSLKAYHLDILVPLLFIIIGMVIGLALKPQNIYISIICSMFMVWFAVAIVPTVISSSIAMFTTFIGILMLYGGQRK